MSNGLRVLLHAITGLIVGLCVVFIGVAVTLMLSFFNATAVGIPGLIGAIPSPWNRPDSY